MTQSITTSIRLSPKLRNQLEQAARHLHRGKNWIIMQALQEYLAQLDRHTLAEEARRQSILVSQADKKEDEGWEENTDTSEWN